MELKSEVNDISQWLPNWVFRAESKHQIQGSWAEPLQIEIDGSFDIDEINGDGLSLSTTTIKSRGIWDGDLNINNTLQSSKINAIGVQIPEFLGDFKVAVSEDGLIDVQGQTKINSVIVGEQAVG